MSGLENVTQKHNFAWLTQGPLFNSKVHVDGNPWMFEERHLGFHRLV
jgi:hypothetical protein